MKKQRPVNLWRKKDPPKVGMAEFRKILREKDAQEAFVSELLHVWRGHIIGQPEVWPQSSSVLQKLNYDGIRKEIKGVDYRNMDLPTLKLHFAAIHEKHGTTKLMAAFRRKK